MLLTKNCLTLLLCSLVTWGGTYTLATASDNNIHIVKRVNVGAQVDVAGTVVARKTTRFSAQIPGRIAMVAGKEGDHFEKGAELLRIDDSALRAKLDAAIAQRDASLASIRNANAQLQREVYSPQSRAGSSAPGGMGMPSMMDQMFTNPMQNMMGMRDRGSERYSDLVNRETQLAQANTQYKKSLAQIKEIEASLRDSLTLAPFSGVIESLDVEKGDTVQPGQPLLAYSEVTGHQVEVDVPVRLVGNLSQGKKLPVRLDGRGDPLVAVISRIFPVADRSQHTVRVEMDLADGAPTTVGQYAEVVIPGNSGAERSLLLIPHTAVIRKGGLPLVFSLDEQGKTKLRVVRLGERSQESVTVLSGLREGDRIVKTPTPGLRAGTLIQQ